MNNTSETVTTAYISRMSWSAVISGVIATAGIWVLLHVFGMGMGLTAIEPDDPSSLRGVGIGTGIWSMIVPLIALFVGGLITGYLDGAIRRLDAVVQGVVMWSIATIVSIALMLSFVGSVLGGAARAGGQVVSATGAVAGTAAMGVSEFPEDVLNTLGLTANDLLAPVNERLREDGKPAVTADQLTAAMRDVLQTAVREGRLDRELIVESLAQHTEMTRREAADIANQVEAQWEQRSAALTERAKELAQSAEQAALQAAETSGKVLLALFGIMALGLIATEGGVLLAAMRRRRVIKETSTTTHRP